MDFFFVFHVIVCILLIAVILFQEGKAGGLTSVSDSAQSVFGARGATSVLTKMTSVLAILFMATSLFLNFTHSSGNESIAAGHKPETTQEESTLGTLENPSEPGTADAAAGEVKAGEDDEAAADTSESDDATTKPEGNGEQKEEN